MIRIPILGPDDNFFRALESALRIAIFERSPGPVRTVLERLYAGAPYGYREEISS